MITKLDEMAPKDSIIASNSSSYTISEIIAGLNLRDASRIVSAHSYWPPETSAIEIMGHETTDPAAVTLLLDECQRHGFSPFHVKKDSMGYIYNR
jgi:3-hydroxyacyl-CoA dehydrogenase